MGIGVKVVVSGSHVLGVEGLGHLPSAGTAGQAGRVRRVGWSRHMVDRGHGPGQWGGLGRLGLDDADWLWMLLLQKSGEKKEGQRETEREKQRKRK